MEKKLTIMVPIVDEDCTEVQVQPTLANSVEDVIYKYNGRYWRKVKDEYSGVWSITNPVDREFPFVGQPLEIFDFTYSATRMGNAPTISAQNVMWQHPLKSFWEKYRLDAHVVLGGEKYYLKSTPSETRSNEDERYKYSMDFVSERIVLEEVYFYDVTLPYDLNTPTNGGTKFSFYGDINVLARRLNASLIASGLAKPRQVLNGSYLTLSEWNRMGGGSLRYLPNDWLIYDATTQQNVPIYKYYNGSYIAYLNDYVFAHDAQTGELIIDGYKVEVGTDKDGNPYTSDEKLLTFDNTKIIEALKMVKEEFDLLYYIHRDSDGNIVITFGDNGYEIPSTEPFEYGVDSELLSWGKNNAGNEIVTRCSGLGSEENIPWYYPNPTPDGWVKPVFNTETHTPALGGVPFVWWSDISKDGLSAGGYSAAYINANFDRLCEIYLRNRLKSEYTWGKVVETFNQNMFLYEVDRGDGTDGLGEPPTTGTGIAQVPVSYVANFVESSGGTSLLRNYRWRDSIYSPNSGYALVWYKFNLPAFHVLDVKFALKNDLEFVEALAINEDNTHLTVVESIFDHEGEDRYDHIGGQSDNDSTFTSFYSTATDVYLGLRLRYNPVPVSTATNLYFYPARTVRLSLFRNWPSLGTLQMGFDPAFTSVVVETLNEIFKVGAFDVYFPAFLSTDGTYKFNETSTDDYRKTGWQSANGHFLDENKLFRETLPILLYGANGYDPSTMDYATFDAKQKRNKKISVFARNVENQKLEKVTFEYLDGVKKGYQSAGSIWAGEQTKPLNTLTIRTVTGAITVFIDRGKARSGWYSQQNIAVTNDVASVINDVDLSVKIWQADAWYDEKGKSIGRRNMDATRGFSFSSYLLTEVQNLSSRRSGIPSPDNNNAYPFLVGDKITFDRVKYLTPQKNLVPELYYLTDGARRFYPAVNYPTTTYHETTSGSVVISTGSLDKDMGEVYDTVSEKVRNPLYYDPDREDNIHYKFENTYIAQRPHEHVEEFPDIKPSITGMEYYQPIYEQPADWSSQYGIKYYVYDDTTGGFVFSGPTFVADGSIHRKGRIDVIQEFAYDAHDNDEINESTDDGSEVSGEYKHPHFFAKLPKMPFNLFDLALTEDMEINMTTGACGACKFKIKVDENTKKNPVQIWTKDVYVYDEDDEDYVKIHSKGDIRRYEDTLGFFFKYGSTYYQINSVPPAASLLSIPVTTLQLSTTRTMDIAQSGTGFLTTGSLKMSSNKHETGDVMTSGRYIDEQQDTMNNCVWVALEKDTETYGQMMPLTRTMQDGGAYTVTIHPKSVKDVHVANTSLGADDDSNADKFVITNIKFPLAYLRAAEHKLSKAIVDYMSENNAEKFNFTVKLSRIYMEQHQQLQGILDENTVLTVITDSASVSPLYPRISLSWRQYVSVYSYRMTKGEPLPEVSVELNQEVGVRRNSEQRRIHATRTTTRQIDDVVTAAVETERNLNKKKFVTTTGTSIVHGNIVDGNTMMSLQDVHDTTAQLQGFAFDTQKKMARMEEEQGSGFGEKVTPTWRTLTNDEWEYILYDREASTVSGTENARYIFARIEKSSGVYVDGLLLFPDEYTHPHGVTAPTNINTAAATSNNTYSLAEWAAMEAVGCVFLPAGLIRLGATVNTTYSEVAYWSTTTDDSSSTYGWCLYVNFSSSQMYTGGQSGSKQYKWHGCSVRLVSGYDNLTRGGFSCNADGEKVCFAQGNLQYQASSNTWRFAANQYDVIGNAAGNNVSSGRNTQSNWIDLFGYGTSGWNSGATTYNPYAIDSTNANYLSEDLTGEYANADWGVFNSSKLQLDLTGLQRRLDVVEMSSIPTWRVPTIYEWKYLLGLSTTARTCSTVNGVDNARFVKARIDLGSSSYVSGLIIFPDVFTMPTNDGHGNTITAPSGINDKTSSTAYSANTYTLTEWSVIEAAGAAFLPYVTCRRSDGESGNTIGSGYWSSTYGQYLWLKSNREILSANGATFANCVRLIKEDGSGTFSFSSTVKARIAKGNLVYKQIS